MGVEVEDPEKNGRRLVDPGEQLQGGGGRGRRPAGRARRRWRQVAVEIRALAGDQLLVGDEPVEAPIKTLYRTGGGVGAYRQCPIAATAQHLGEALSRQDRVTHFAAAMMVWPQAGVQRRQRWRRAGHRRDGLGEAGAGSSQGVDPGRAGRPVAHVPQTIDSQSVDADQKDIEGRTGRVGAR